MIKKKDGYFQNNGRYVSKLHANSVFSIEEPPVFTSAERQDATRADGDEGIIQDAPLR